MISKKIYRPENLLKKLNEKTFFQHRSVLFFCLMLFFSLSFKPSYAAIIEGKGSAPRGDLVDVGCAKIPWSKANSYFGYLYGIKGLMFTEIVTGPSCWDMPCYQTYSGFQDISEINNTLPLSFSTPEMVVFTNEASQLDSTPHRGIMVLKYYDTYIAINFTKIENDTLYYEYWYNTSGECIFDDTLLSETIDEKKTICFAQDAVYEFDYSQDYNNLEISGGANVTMHADLNIENTLTILNGKLTLEGDNVYLNDLEISEDGTLEISFDTEIVIKGSFINNGKFNANAGSVIFNGPQPQTITGATTFYALTIDSTTYVLTDTIQVEELSIDDGVFIPGDHSIFKNTYIDYEGILFLPQGVTLYVKGDLDNKGKFYHNNSTVVLDGTSDQVIYTNGNAFYNLFIEGDKTVTFDEVNIINLLEVDLDSRLVIEMTITDEGE